MISLGYHHSPDEWRLFIDSSKSSLKAVLLHHDNCKPSVPVAYAVGLKESYKSTEMILNLISYSLYKWKICGDLKVISLLLGLQLGYTKYSCFLCLWDSRDDPRHFIKKSWPTRESFEEGKHNVVHQPLVNPHDVYLPPLHIKLGLMKAFVRALDTSGTAFQYLKEKFGAHKSIAKLKAGVFIGPEI